MASKYTISDSGWINGVEQDVINNNAFSLVVSGKSAHDIIQRTTEMGHRLSNFPLFQKGLAAALSLVPGSKVLPVAPELVISVLASIGALGGAVGAVATCTGIAVSHGYSLSFVYNFGKLFDPTDDSIEFQLNPPEKTN